MPCTDLRERRGLAPQSLLVALCGSLAVPSLAFAPHRSDLPYQTVWIDPSPCRALPGLALPDLAEHCVGAGDSNSDVCRPPYLEPLTRHTPPGRAIPRIAIPGRAIPRVDAQGSNLSACHPSYL